MSVIADDLEAEADAILVLYKRKRDKMTTLINAYEGETVTAKEFLSGVMDEETDLLNQSISLITSKLGPLRSWLSSFFDT